jgi:outer membrane protein OmpA-like peptidoglycan-associated protein
MASGMACGVAAGITCASDIAHAEPRLSASGFVGVDWLGRRNELGNSWAPEQVPGTAPLVGGRLSWLVLPDLPGGVQLAVEGELAFAPAFTGHDDAAGRADYFAPVFEWRAHALVRLARWREIEPHLVVGGGGDTVASGSPYVTSETDPIAYWGPGVSMPISTSWDLRLDLRQGVLPARSGGAAITFQVQLGVSTTFDWPAARTPRHSIATAQPGAAAPAAAIAPAASRVEPLPAALPMSAAPRASLADPQPAVAPADRDNDGIADDDDRCPDEAEDLDGFQDSDGCPDPDNDGDGIADVRDACPTDAETVNGFADDDGCPDTIPDDVAAALAIRMAFEPNRARVSAPASAVLEPLLAVLQRHPMLHLAIVAHADHPAGRPASTDLAKRRADAVKWHLIDQGIAEDRLVTRLGDAAGAPVTFELVVARP